MVFPSQGNLSTELGAGGAGVVAGGGGAGAGARSGRTEGSPTAAATEWPTRPATTALRKFRPTGVLAAGAGVLGAGKAAVVVVAAGFGGAVLAGGGLAAGVFAGGAAADAGVLAAGAGAPAGNPVATNAFADACQAAILAE